MGEGWTRDKDRVKITGKRNYREGKNKGEKEGRKGKRRRITTRMNVQRELLQKLII